MSSLDILFERLKTYDEVTLLELLDISAEDLLSRFRDRVISKRESLYGEVELFCEESEDEVDHALDELDGFQYEENYNED